MDMTTYLPVGQYKFSDNKMKISLNVGLNNRWDLSFQQLGQHLIGYSMNYPKGGLLSGFIVLVFLSKTVYDKDTFTDDDKMGDAQIDIRPYIECLRAGVSDLPSGTIVDKILPTRENCLADASKIVWKDGKLLQDMILRLNNVVTGEVEIQIEFVNVLGTRGLNF